jgi:hypothetical protein
LWLVRELRSRHKRLRGRERNGTQHDEPDGRDQLTPCPFSATLTRAMVDLHTAHEEHNQDGAFDSATSMVVVLPAPLRPKKP